MNNHLYVLDTNVFLDIFFERPNKQKALMVLEKGVNQDISLSLPSTVLDEVCIILNMHRPRSTVQMYLKHLDSLIEFNILQVVTPHTQIRMKALEIMDFGNEKSGYPEFTDSLFHALAIETNAVFITSDRKHLIKTQQFGHIALLKDIELEKL